MKDESHSEPKIPLTPICQKSTERKKGKIAPIEMVHLKRKEKNESSCIEKKMYLYFSTQFVTQKCSLGLRRHTEGPAGNLLLIIFRQFSWEGGGGGGGGDGGWGGGSHKSKHEPRG